MASKQDLENWFEHHSPFGDQSARYDAINKKALELGEVVLEMSPSCADQTVALRKLRETVMFIKATIACNEKRS